MTSLALRLAGLTGVTALSGCVACGISSSSPDDVDGVAGSGSANAGSGGTPSSGAGGSGQTSSGGSSAIPDDCAPFAEWDPALRAAVQEATGSNAPEPEEWAALSFLGVKGGSTAVGVECLVGLEGFRWDNASAVFPASALGRLPRLERVQFEGSEVDLSGVQNSGSWRRLYLVDAPATDFGALADFIGLEILTLNGAQAPQLIDVAAMTTLRYLNVDRTPVSDLGSLASHPTLLALDANETSVTNLAPLVSIPLLESVWVLGNTLDAESLDAHIPALLSAGVCVGWEDPPGTVHVGPARCASEK